MIELSEERWRSITDFPGYRVSDHGRVMGSRRGILKPDTIKGGYHRVTLCVNGKTSRFQVHKLVLQEFVGPSELQGRHLDGNSQNNRLDNLAYGTRSQNEQDKKLVGTFQSGQRNPFSVLTQAQAEWVREISAREWNARRLQGHTRRRPGFQDLLAKELNVTVGCIKNITGGRAWNYRD